MKSVDIVFGFECSGNRGPVQALSSCGRWTGVPLRAVLGLAGVKAQAREFVFFGADRGPEEVEFRGNITKGIEQQFGRSLPRDIALSNEPFIAYAMNGEPLTMHQGFPLRLIIPGWYGVSNVKWLAEINVQEDAYLGKWQARNYRTLKGEMINGEMKWVESAISRMRLKSFVARVTKTGGRTKSSASCCTTARRSRASRSGSTMARGSLRSWTSRRDAKVRLEAVHLQLEGRHAGRAHAYLARHRHQRQGAADCRRPREQEDVPRGQLAGAEEDHDYVELVN